MLWLRGFGVALAVGTAAPAGTLPYGLFRVSPPFASDDDGFRELPIEANPLLADALRPPVLWDPLP